MGTYQGIYCLVGGWWEHRIQNLETCGSYDVASCFPGEKIINLRKEIFFTIKFFYIFINLD